MATQISISTRFILDTNVAIDFMNQPEEASRRVDPRAEMFVPIIVLGELFFGARRSNKMTENLAKVEVFASATKVLVIDLGIARYFGEIHAALRAKGRPIPENDIWIAATALCHGLPVATRDAHFREVAGLQVLDW